MSEFEQQHAIPQQISAYQFRLVGDMTLAQFFKLAAGALISLLIYATNLPAIIKWPVIIVSFLIGVAMAFFPLEGRPLEKWFILFVKSIYSPTIYLWNQSKAVKTYFRPEDPTPLPMVNLPQTQDQEIEQQAQMAPVGQIEESKKSLKALEKNEEEFLSKVTSNLQSASTTPIQASEEKTENTSLGTRKISIPKDPNIEVEKPETQTESQEKDIQKETIESKITPAEVEEEKTSKQADFTPEASPPTPPTTPNIVVGQVLETTGEIIEAAILEIKDDLGRPTRAVKTNKLGHFQIVTPLIDGNYKILTEKDGFQFDTIEFEAKGEIIPPIMIKGQKQENPNEDQEKTSKD